MQVFQMTRTVFYRSVSPEQRRVYEAVKEAKGEVWIPTTRAAATMPMRGRSRSVIIGNLLLLCLAEETGDAYRGRKPTFLYTLRRVRSATRAARSAPAR